jgi:predicted peroxiredoxin
MKKAFIAAALAVLSSTAFADKQAVTVVVTSSSNMTQGMAMVLVNQMQAQGGQVDILLCDKAGDLALKTAGGEALKPQNVTPSQLLDAAIKKGATASVCALYLPNTGHAPDALKDGITAAKPDAMGRSLLEAGRKVMAF